MDSRVLTITELYATPSSKKPVPLIRIQGKWLGELGFRIGDRVEVYGEKESVTIKLVKEQDR